MNFTQLRSKAKLWSVSTWLIGACVVVFVLQSISPMVTRAGALTIGDGIAGGQIWRLITFQFLHGGLLHLAFNCYGLFLFGQMAERKIGRARFLAYYLLCGIGGGLGFVLLWASGIVDATQQTPLVGASAGLFGCIAAAMTLVPNRILQLALPPIDITIFRFGAVYLVLAAFIVIFHGDTTGSNAGGEAAHLGGAAVGFLLARHLGWLSWVDRFVPRQLRSPGQRQGGSTSDVKTPKFMKYHGWR